MKNLRFTSHDTDRKILSVAFMGFVWILCAWLVLINVTARGKWASINVAFMGVLVMCLILIPIQVVRYFRPARKRDRNDERDA